MTQAVRTQDEPQPAAPVSDAPGVQGTTELPRTSLGRVVAWAAIARALWVLKDSMVARQFGASADLDAILIGTMVPLFALTTFIGPLAEMLMPRYSDAVKRGDGTGAAWVRNSTALALGAMIVISLVLAFGRVAILSPLTTQLGVAGKQTASNALLLTLPTAFIAGLISVWTPLLNVHRFGSFVARLTIVTPVATVVTLLALGRQLGAYVLTLGVFVAAVAQLVFVGARLRSLGLLLRPRLGEPRVLRATFSQYPALLVAGVLGGGVHMVDNFFASRQGPGVVAAFSYGVRLPASIQFVLGIAVSTYFAPELARLVSQGDRKALVASVNRTLRIVLGWGMVGALVLALGSSWIAELFYPLSRLGEGQAKAVADIQACMFLGTPIALASDLLTILLVALRAGTVLFYFALGGMFLSVVFNFLLIRLIGVPGIAASTVLMQAFVVVASYYVFRIYARRLGT